MLKQALQNLIDELIVLGFSQPAKDIYKILLELNDDESIKEEENDDAVDPISAVNVVGLRGDVKPEQPTGGVTVNPFFFDSGDSF